MSKVPAHYELINDIIKLRDEIAPQTLLTINGDIRDRAHGEELFAAHPGLNGIMIGRGIFSDPFCFVGSKVSEASSDEKTVDCSRIADNPTERSRQISSEDLSEKCASNQNGAPFANALEHKSELIALLHYHLDLFDRYQPTLDRPFETLKRFFKIYIRDFDGAKELRDQLMHTKNTSEVRQILEEI